MPAATPPRPFRFAAGLGDRVDATGLVEYARRVESWGYSTLLIPDHLFERLAPLPALAAVAEVTSRLRIGTFVLNVNLLHPAVLAQELATLDRLSGGRLEIGLGAGWNAEEHHQAGLPFEAHRVRVERLGEAIEVLKELFAPRPFSFRGRHYWVTELEGRPGPAQRPHPPFLVGGRRLLELAARQAQIVGLAARIPAPYRHNPQRCLAEATAGMINTRPASASARRASSDGVSRSRMPASGARCAPRSKARLDARRGQRNELAAR